MNATGWWLSLDAAGYRLAWVLLSVLWQSSILLLAAAGLAWLLRRRRATVRHALWVTAVLVSLLAPLLGWMVERSGTPQAQILIVPAYSSPVCPLPSAVQAEPVALAAPPEAAQEATPVQEHAQAGPAAAAVAPAPTAIQAEWPAQPLSAAQGRPSLLAFGWAWALLAYAAGAAALLALVVASRFRIARWVRRGRPVTDARVLGCFQTACERLGLGRHVAIVESARIHSPATVGTLRPVVILPAGLAAEMSDKELKAIALHELAHAMRHDSALLGLLSVVRAVLFFHPLVWLACRQASVLAEIACDDVVLDATGEAVGYAKMLTRLAEQMPRHPLGTELAAGFILSKSAFLRRIEAILANRAEGPRRLSRLGLTATLLTALGALALALALPLGQKAQAQVASRPAAATQPADAAVKSVLIVRLRFASAPAMADGIRGYSQNVVIMPDERSNSLLLSGPEREVAAATALIAELDKAPTAVASRPAAATRPADAAAKSVMWTLPLKFASAEDVANVMRANVARGRFQHLVIMPDERSNSLILSGPEQDMAPATALIAKLDTAPAAVASRPAAAPQPADAAVKIVVRTLQLKFAPAPDVAKLIRGHSQSVVITADQQLNALVLSGPEQDLDAATALIAELDKAAMAVVSRSGAEAGSSGKPESLPARFQAVVYQVSVPASRIAELDAQALSGRAKTAAEFQKHLEGLVAKGSPKVLYAVDQILDLSSNSRINIGANEPIVTNTSGSSSKPAVTVSYQSLGGIFTIGGSGGGDNKLRIRLSIDLSALSDSTVQLSNDVRATTLRHATIQHNGPVEQGKPFVAITVDAAGEQGGSATAFICRAVVGEAK